MEGASKEKLRVGVLGATGMVGRRFIERLVGHPYFDVTAVAASERSLGKSYAEAVGSRWEHKTAVPEGIKKLNVYSVKDGDAIGREVDFVFSALDMPKDEIRSLEESYAAEGMPVISNNSAHRWTEDVPMIMPEINPHHIEMIPFQQKNRGWSKGFIAVKPNCSIQGYVPVLKALERFEPQRAIVTTFQAVSGAGKRLKEWPEMVDNVIPFIAGEEEKSAQEPKKIFAHFTEGRFTLSQGLTISPNCFRAPVEDGHMAVVNVSFKHAPVRQEFIDAINNFRNPLKGLDLPSAPDPFLTYFDTSDRPQTKLDRDIGNGMGVSVGRLREDTVLKWKFVALSHNTVRGAAGGAILVAELLKKKGYLGS